MDRSVRFTDTWYLPFGTNWTCWMNQIQARETVWFIVQTRKLMKLEGGASLRHYWLGLLFVKTHGWSAFLYLPLSCRLRLMLCSRGLLVLPRSVSSRAAAECFVGFESGEQKIKNTSIIFCSLDLQFSGGGNGREFWEHPCSIGRYVSSAQTVEHSTERPTSSGRQRLT